MYLKISSPEKVIFDGKILKATIPTEGGDITVLPNHMPLVSVVKPGVMSIWPAEQHKETDQFVFNDETIHISLSKGMIYVDGKNVSVVTAIATASPEENTNTLKTMKKDLENKIVALKKEGSIEEIERSLIKLEKIRADIKLATIKEKQ